MLQVLHQTPAGIMEPRPEAGLPATLGRWVGEIVLSIPQPARRTVAELIVGGLLAGGGHVTQAFLALTPRLGWQAYHWMLVDARARSVPAAGLGCRAVRHCAARGPRGTVLRHHRRHARAPCIGQGAGSGRALRPCP